MTAAVSPLRIRISTTSKKQCGSAVDLVHASVGTSEIRDEQPFQRHFRDIHTITQHGFISAGRYQSVGQYALGVPIEWPFYGI